MDYIRTTIQIDSLNGIITIPSNFKSKEVEIFIFPKEKKQSKKKNKKVNRSKKDSIFLIGKNPIKDTISNGSISHDSYIYV